MLKKMLKKSEKIEKNWKKLKKKSGKMRKNN